MMASDLKCTRKKRVIWTDTAVNVMLNIFEEKKILEHLDGSRYRNENVFKMVVNELNKQLASKYTVSEVRIKWKSLKKNYKEVQIKNGTGGHNKVSCKFYDRLCEFMGHRAISKPMANGVDSSSMVNDSDNEIQPQNLMEEFIIEEDEIICTNQSLPTDTDSTDDAMTPEQTGKKSKVSIAPPRNAAYKKSLKAFSKDVAEEAKKLQADFFVEQEKLMNAFFEKQKKWEEEVLEKEEARSLADRISNENIMKNLMTCIAKQSQSQIQFPYHQNNELYFNPTSDYSSTKKQP